jgi:hypothetical protein
MITPRCTFLPLVLHPLPTVGHVVPPGRDQWLLCPSLYPQGHCHRGLCSPLPTLGNGAVCAAWAISASWFDLPRREQVLLPSFTAVTTQLEWAGHPTFYYSCTWLTTPSVRAFFGPLTAGANCLSWKKHSHVDTTMSDFRISLFLFPSTGVWAPGLTLAR